MKIDFNHNVALRSRLSTYGRLEKLKTRVLGDINNPFKDHKAIKKTNFLSKIVKFFKNLF